MKRIFDPASQTNDIVLDVGVVSGFVLIRRRFNTNGTCDCFSWLVLIFFRRRTKQSPVRHTLTNLHRWNAIRVTAISSRVTFLKEIETKSSVRSPSHVTNTWHVASKNLHWLQANGVSIEASIGSCYLMAFQQLKVMSAWILYTFHSVFAVYA